MYKTTTNTNKKSVKFRLRSSTLNRGGDKAKINHHEHHSDHHGFEKFRNSNAKIIKHLKDGHKHIGNHGDVDF